MDNFFNFKIGTLTREKYSHNYDNNIESVIKNIKFEKSQSYIIRRIQILIQLVTIKTIHCSHGLSIDELVFDPISIKKHGLTYIILSRIRTNFFYLFIFLSNMNFLM